MPASNCSKCGAPISIPSDPSAEGPIDANINVMVAPGTLARHQELPTTNRPPEGAGLSFIQSVVSKTGALLEVVESEISRLKTRLQLLEEEHASLCDFFPWTDLLTGKKERRRIYTAVVLVRGIYYGHCTCIHQPALKEILSRANE
jgi:hypothetical protein